MGIGYVGAVTSACLCESNHKVIAVDIDPTKVNMINNGQSPFFEKGLDALIKTHIESQNLSATTDLNLAVQNSDIIIICVGTPSNADGSLDLSYVQNVCQDVGASIKKTNDYKTIIMRSTVLPGSCENICIPIIEEYSDKKVNEGFGFGFNPEFLREGSAIQDYFEPPKIVVGTQDSKTSDIIFSLYKNIEAPHVQTDIKISEGVKYADNVWHAVKIGFANEIGNILSDSGIDSHKVMEIFCKDKKLNISNAYLKPGFAYGGSCLPKDLRAIRALGHSLSLKTPIFDALESANDNQVSRAFDKIIKLNPKRILLLGLSFKAGTDDTRESPLLTLADKILNKKVTFDIYDPYVKAESLREKSKIANRLINQYDINDYDLIIIGNSNPEFLNIVKQAQSQNINVFDLVRLSPEIEKQDGYYGLCW